MKTVCEWIHSDEYLADLLLAILGIVGLPIRDESVFLFVGYERVQVLEAPSQMALCKEAHRCLNS